jgi:aryl-alcohol dehydrogenase-like predicted oxidoreductase
VIRRKLGRSDLSVMPLCFGGNVLGWTVDEQTSFAVFDELFGSFQLSLNQEDMAVLDQAR